MNVFSKIGTRLKNRWWKKSGNLFIFGSPEALHEAALIRLFQTEAIFRTSVIETDEIFVRQGHPGFLTYFDGTAGNELPESPSVNILVGVAIQFALLDLCRSRNLEPDAVAGIGLGEIVAMNAAGAVTREEAIQMLSAILKVAKMEDDSMLPMHNSILSKYRSVLIQSLQDLVPGPVHCDYYSATLGKKVPGQSTLPEFLIEDLIALPIHPDQIIQLIKTEPWKTVIHCGTSSVTSLFPNQFLTNALKSRGVQLIFNSTGITSRAYKKLIGSAVNVPAKPAQAASKRYQTFLQHYDILSPNSGATLPAAFSYLREYGDIHFFSKSNSWLVVSHELVKEVLHDHSTFSNLKYSDKEPYLLGADPPDHTRIRSMVQPHFSARSIESAAQRAEREISERLNILSRQPRFDIVDDLSVPIVQAVIGRFLGMDAQSFSQLQALMPKNIYDGEISMYTRNFFVEYMKRQEPAGEHIGMKHHLQHAVNSGAMQMEEAISLITLFWDAGIFTTSIHLTNLVFELLTRPEMGEKISGSPELVSEFISECLRLYAPGIQVMRVAKKDTILGGQLIKEGSKVAVGMLAANRDPRVFPQSALMNLGRSAKRDFVFGGGIHFCPGHHLAKREAESMVQNIIPLLDRLQLDPARPWRRLDRLGFNGMSSLPVYWK